MSITSRLRALEEVVDELINETNSDGKNWINEQLKAIREFIGMEQPPEIKEDDNEEKLQYGKYIISCSNKQGDYLYYGDEDDWLNKEEEAMKFNTLASAMTCANGIKSPKKYADPIARTYWPKDDPSDTSADDEEEEQLYHIRISSKDSVMYLTENDCEEDDPFHFEWNKHPSNSSKFTLLEGNDLLRKNQFPSPSRSKSYGKPMLETV